MGATGVSSARLVPNNLSSNEQVSVGKIDVSVSGSGYDKFYRTTRIE